MLRLAMRVSNVNAGLANTYVAGKYPACHSLGNIGICQSGIKWGYSLMLRLAMRVSNVNAGLANTYVAKAVAGGVFASNADNVWVPMALTPSIWTNRNGISRAFYPGDGGQPAFLSKRLIDWLKGSDQTITADDDPRLMIVTGGIGDWTA